MSTPKNTLHRRRSIGISLGLIIFVGWTFFPALRNGFVYDDALYVCENPNVLGGLNWQNIRWAFTNLEAGFWHPLTWLSLLLDYQLYGLEAWGYHLTSLILHGANTTLLFLALQRMTGAAWRSAFVAACFGLHPLHVESAAWVSERKDVLSTLFWMLTMLTYAGYVEQKRSRKQIGHASSALLAKPYYLLSLTCFVMGLMSKTMVVTLPLILLLLDWWPLQRIRFKPEGFRRDNLLPLIREKVPFFAAALVCGALTIHAERGVGALASTTQNPLAGRVYNAFLSYLSYLRQTVWPVDLAAHYPYPATFSFWPTLGAVMLFLAISAAALCAARRRPYFTAGWIWYVLTLLPVIGLIQVGEFSRADRFTYIPLIGVFLGLTWGVCDWAQKHRSRIPPIATAGAVVILCAALTRRQIGWWKDDETLWLHALNVTTKNLKASYNLGVVYFNRGVSLATQGEFDQASREYRKAIELDPRRDDAHSSLAYALLKKGLVSEAISEYELSLSLNPNNAEAHNNLGNILARQDRAEEAIQHLTEALRLRSDYPEAHDNLGGVLASRGRYAEAAAHFQEVLRLKPEDAEVRRKLNRALAAQQEPQQGVSLHKEALSTDPGNARTHGDLGRALVETGGKEEAIERYAEAARREPKNVTAQYQLGLSLAQKGEAEGAARQFELVLGLDPGSAPAHFALGVLCQQGGRRSEALEHWRTAARLSPQWPDPLNNLAWALATDPNAGLRDGPEAVKLAERAVELSRTNNPGVLDTLAAAYAEVGRFSEAISVAKRAKAAAIEQGETALATGIQQRFERYIASQAYREGPPFK